MANDITFAGTVVTIVASTTFPQGFQVTDFSDDADPIDFASVKIGDAVMGVNGDLITFSRAVALPMTLSVIPGSADDVNLSILANANRVSKDKFIAYDLLTTTVIYPDGTQVTLINGKLTDAPFGKSGSSAGRLKTRTYSFLFESNVGS
jgi:hypothetical protein